jgi:hypothetical protein
MKLASHLSQSVGYMEYNFVISIYSDIENATATKLSGMNIKTTDDDLYI